MFIPIFYRQILTLLPSATCFNNIFKKFVEHQGDICSNVVEIIA